MSDSELQKGILAAKTGHFEEARAILARLVIEEPENEDAWLWLSGVVKGDAKKLYCLRKVLLINPRNEKAILGLRRLQASEHVKSSQFPTASGYLYKPPQIEFHTADRSLPVTKDILPAAIPDSSEKAAMDQPPLHLPSKPQTPGRFVRWAADRGWLFGLLPILQYFARRFFYMVGTLVLVTALLYGAFVSLVTPEMRAMAYLPPWGAGRWGNVENLVETKIQEHGLKDPFLIQYSRWAANLLRGDWGTSTNMNDEVLNILLQRTPATVELLLFSLMLFIPLGLANGVVAGWRRGRAADYGFRLNAFVATSIPPFVLGLMLLAIFYIGLHWFPPGRLSSASKAVVNSPDFRSITTLLTLDGILNGRLDISLDAIRHLFLPAATLSLSYWATLGRVTRASVIEELQSDYIATARSKGLHSRQVVWQHAFRNAVVPGLNSIALSAAMFLTNAIIIEIIFGYPGLSRPLSLSLISNSPDIYLAMGFAVISILLVLPLMFILDLIQGVVDPRIREGAVNS